MAVNSGFRASLVMDNDQQSLGNSPGSDGRGRLHTFIANDASEPIPVVFGSLPVTLVNEFQELASAPSGSESTISTYTVPVGKTLSLDRIEVGGENIATYNVYVDLVLVARIRTFFGSALTATLDFTSPNREFQATAGQVIEVKVQNFRPTPANFESRLQGTLS